MIDNDTLIAIQADIALIEPEADSRLKSRTERYKKAAHIVRSTRDKKHKKPAKKYYQPVVQSYHEHDDVDYDLL